MLGVLSGSALVARQVIWVADGGWANRAYFMPVFTVWPNGLIPALFAAVGMAFLLLAHPDGTRAAAALLGSALACVAAAFFLATVMVGWVEPDDSSLPLRTSVGPIVTNAHGAPVIVQFTDPESPDLSASLVAQDRTVSVGYGEAGTALLFFEPDCRLLATVTMPLRVDGDPLYTVREDGSVDLRAVSGGDLGAAADHDPCAYRP